MRNKFLLITATHGNEDFSLAPLQKIKRLLPSQKYGYDSITGNPQALKKGVRFVDCDLNRCAPGNKKSQLLEERRASQIISLSKKYSFLIDIHGTESNSGVFTIITNPTLSNLLLAASLPITNVVIWAAKESQLSGPLTQFTSCPSVEIECGPKNNNQIKKELTKILKQIIKNPYPTIQEVQKNLKRQKYFVVYGKTIIEDTSVKEFTETKINGEVFFPMLVNAYQKGSTRTLKPLDLFSALSY